jgi:hypothetical protein
MKKTTIDRGRNSGLQDFKRFQNSLLFSPHYRITDKIRTVKSILFLFAVSYHSEKEPSLHINKNLNLRLFKSEMIY